MSNLYSEEDILRNAAGKNFKAKGFDRKAYNKIFNEKSGSNFSDSAIGHALPTSYYNLDDSFSGGGAMPPPGGNYYQAGQPGQPRQPAQQQKPGYTSIFSHMLKGFYDVTIGGVKEGIYDIYTRWPVILRDKLMTKANDMGKIPNFLSSLYAIGADCGPIQRVVDDWDDRLEIITDGENRVLAIRTYNTRKENGLIRWLRKGKDSIIPRVGRAVESMDDLYFTIEGQVQGVSPGVGGQLLSLDGVQYDDFYGDSDNEYWVTHGESKTSNPGRFRKNIISFALSHYVYHHGASEVKDLETHPKSGKITRITLPYGFSPNQWDSDLALKTYGTAIGIYITHFLYALAEKGYEKAGRKEQAKKIEQSELDRMFIPDMPVIPRLGYG
jgi:hypothetical protein